MPLIFIIHTRTKHTHINYVYPMYNPKRVLIQPTYGYCEGVRNFYWFTLFDLHLRDSGFYFRCESSNQITG